MFKGKVHIVMNISYEGASNKIKWETLVQVVCEWASRCRTQLPRILGKGYNIERRFVRVKSYASSDGKYISMKKRIFIVAFTYQG